MDNNIEYYVKSNQVKTTIVKCTKVRKKGLKLNLSQKEMLVYTTYMWRYKISLNTKQSRKLSNVIGHKICPKYLMKPVMCELEYLATYYQVSIIKF